MAIRNGKIAKDRQEISRLKYAVEDLIIAWIAMGLTIGQIAGNLKRSNKAVEYRWALIRQRLGFRCYQDATRYAIKTKLIPLRLTYD